MKAPTMKNYKSQDFFGEMHRVEGITYRSLEIPICVLLYYLVTTQVCSSTKTYALTACTKYYKYTELLLYFLQLAIKSFLFGLLCW